MKWADAGIPNPGSDEARNGGCLCPVADNNRGKWPPVPGNGWWITEGCPMHCGKKVAPEACGHCGETAVGYARAGDGTRLCHPETGPDCYRLVTVYRHDPHGGGQCGRCAAP